MKIKAEIEALGRHYGNADANLLQALDSPLMNEYVEIVLCADHFELVLGGLDKADELVGLARSQGFEEDVVSMFQAFAAQFSGKMLYTKLMPERANEPGSMYFVSVEPWTDVIAFLAAHSFSPAVLTQLEAAIGKSKICFLLGFSFDPDRGGLVVKAYHLHDLLAGDAGRQPFLVSYRFGRNVFDPRPKLYYAKAKWSDFSAQPGWTEVAALGDQLFADRYEMLQGVSESGKQKAYVFRHDIRESENFSLKSYNYYVEEGNRLIIAGFLALSEQAFRNALAFSPGDIDALNRLGYACLMQGRYVEGIGYARQAKAMNPNVTNLIWLWSNPIAEQDAEIARLTAEIEVEPHPERYNARGIYHFHKREYQAAKEDLLKAIELEPFYSEAYNNLGGTYIKLGEFVEAVKSCTIAHSINTATNGSNIVMAREALRLIVDSEQRPSEASFIALGKYYYQLDFFDEAEQCFLKARDFARVSLT